VDYCKIVINVMDISNLHDSHTVGLLAIYLHILVMNEMSILDGHLKFQRTIPHPMLMMKTLLVHVVHMIHVYRPIGQILAHSEYRTGLPVFHSSSLLSFSCLRYLHHTRIPQ